MTGVTIRRIPGLTQRCPVQRRSDMITYQIEVDGEVYAQVSRSKNANGRKALAEDTRELVRYARRWLRSVHGLLHLAR